MFHRAGVRSRRGFSLVELIVVMSIALMLTGLLMPALSAVRENARRVVCSSNQRQIGYAIMMYADDRNSKLPVATALDAGTPNPAELQAATDGTDWDGFGLLYQWGYCTTPDCFYCPSHHGDHDVDVSRDRWFRRDILGPKIYTNYHYSGHRKWQEPLFKRRLSEGHSLVLSTDGLRTAADFNHEVGMNVLRGDGSVNWFQDSGEVESSLPLNGVLDPPPNYHTIWDFIESTQ